MQVEWAVFKKIVDTRKLAMRHVDMTTNYYLYTNDGELLVTCVIQIENPAGEDQTDFETNYKSKSNRSAPAINSPFADKILPNGKKLYTRVHGVVGVVSGAPDNIDFSIPYDNCKLTGIEIIGGNIGDTINMKVLDTPAGLISGVPDYMLNQFGFNVNVAKDYYKRESAYDADLIKDMKIRIEYDSVATLPANVYINFIIHEVKD